MRLTALLLSIKDHIWNPPREPICGTQGLPGPGILAPQGDRHRHEGSGRLHTQSPSVVLGHLNMSGTCTFSVTLHVCAWAIEALLFLFTGFSLQVFSCLVKSFLVVPFCSWQCWQINLGASRLGFFSQIFSCLVKSGFLVPFGSWQCWQTNLPGVSRFRFSLQIFSCFCKRMNFLLQC